MVEKVVATHASPVSICIIVSISELGIGEKTFAECTCYPMLLGTETMRRSYLLPQLD